MEYIKPKAKIGDIVVVRGSMLHDYIGKFAQLKVEDAYQDFTNEHTWYYITKQLPLAIRESEIIDNLS